MGKINLTRFGSRGFTFIELMIAVAFLGFVLPALLFSFFSCIVLNETSRLRSIATTHAQYVMEEIADINVSNMTTRINSGEWDWSTSTIAAKGLVALTNESVDASVSGTGTLDVTVNVTWQGRGGRSSNISLETLFSES